MNTLIFRMLMAALCLATMLAYATAAPTTVNADEYKIRLDEVSSVSQAQVAELSEKVETAESGAQRDDFQRQIEDVKRQAEIQRLNILLEWAEAEGDVERIAEVRSSLDQLMNPPQPQVLPEVDKHVIPETDNSSKSETTR